MLAAESTAEELVAAAGVAAAVSLVVGAHPSDKDLKPVHPGFKPLRMHRCWQPRARRRSWRRRPAQPQR